MQIETGLFDHMVVQRNSKDVSHASFSGTCEEHGPVRATVYRGGKAVKGLAGITVGKAAGGLLGGRLKGVPVGGPYEIRLAVGSETLTVRDVLVGDVWVLGGQSNMQGCGYFPEKPLPAHPRVRAFYMDDNWGPAQDPVHKLGEAVDPVHLELCGGVRHSIPPGFGVSPGPAFGREMIRLTGVPQGMLCCAHGGTTMEQWSPALRDRGGRSLYGAMLRRVAKNGGKVAGLLWYQGCSDANTASARRYSERMLEFVAALRRDSGNRSLPVVMVQIARVIGWGNQEAAEAWNSIQDQQRLLSLAIRRLATVPAIDLPLDDAIHISGDGQLVLGVRMARAMRVLQDGASAGLPPMALKAMKAVRGVNNATDLLVEFSNVQGRLCSEGRPSGFSIEGGEWAFDVKLEGAVARIRTVCTDIRVLNQVALYYGRGTDPYCNITDEGGRSLPVFGPVRSGSSSAVGPFVREWNVSAFQPSAGRLASLDYPSDPMALDMQPRRFDKEFCDLHVEIMQQGGDALVFYAFRFTCAQPMQLALLLGYDGPVKVWVDRKMRLHDPDGTNPAVMDKARVVLEAADGEHEVMVALGTNHGAAWGIFMRLQRLDLSRAEILKGPAGWGLPISANG